MQDVHPLKTYRANQTPKLSQAGPAAKLGVARLTVLRWETGERKVDPSLIPKVTEKTGISAKELRPDLIEEHEKLFGEAAQ
jgi:DNA-binding transcriptional regulator YdaS (Cro superfamily)